MRRARALSLIELIVSLSIVLLLCIFVLNLFPGSLIALRHSELRLEAQRVSESVLEQARATNFDNLAVGLSVNYPKRTLNGEVFSPKLQVRAVPGYATTALKSFTVTVTWQERNDSKQLAQEVWVWRDH